MSFPLFDQRQYQDELGTGQGITIAMDGCAESCVASDCVHFGKQTNPALLNKALISVNGYADNGEGQHDLLDWTAVTRVYPDITLTFNDSYPSNPADLGLIDGQLAKGFPVIVGVSFNHVASDSQASHYVCLYRKNDDGSYQAMDPWGGNDIVFDQVYAVNGMSVPQCILQAVSYDGPAAASPTASGLPANYAEIIGKATNWDGVTALGYTSVEQLAKTIHDLTAARDSNGKSYQGEVARNAELSQQITTLQGEVQKLTDDNTNLKTEISQTNQSNANLAAEIQAMESRNSASVDTGLKAEADLKDIRGDMQAVAGALDTTYPTLANLLSAIDILRKPNEQVVKEYSTLGQALESFFTKKTPNGTPSLIERIRGWFPPKGR